MPYPLIIDSRLKNKSTDTSSNFTVLLSYPRKNHKLKFKKFVGKFSWYPIDSTNNTYSITENVTTMTGTIATPSSWTGTDIATAWTTSLNGLGLANTYLVTYNTATFKYVVSLSAGAANFGFNWLTQNNTLNKILGFNLINDTAGATQTSANVGYTLGFDYIVVKSSNLRSGQNSKSDAYYNTTVALGNTDIRLNDTNSVICTIPVNVGIGGTIIMTEETEKLEFIYQCKCGDSTKQSYACNQQKGDLKILDLIDLQLVNPWTDLPIQMNGSEILFQLEGYCEWN